MLTELVSSSCAQGDGEGRELASDEHWMAWREGFVLSRVFTLESCTQLQGGKNRRGQGGAGWQARAGRTCGRMEQRGRENDKGSRGRGKWRRQEGEVEGTGGGNGGDGRGKWRRREGGVEATGGGSGGDGRGKWRRLEWEVEATGGGSGGVGRGKWRRREGEVEAKGGGSGGEGRGKWRRREGEVDERGVAGDVD
ncbi:unnamed protein product [Closterium sp. NIES-64]|nr:unnamed protein product [Closterium sp. NIES-64]